MFKKFPLFFFLLISCTVFGQTKTSFTETEFDSLWSIWQDEKQADTTRLKAITQYSWYKYLFSQPDSAFYYADVQYKFAEKAESPTHMAAALSTKGIVHWIKGDYIESLKYFQNNLEIREKVGVKGGIAAALNKLGIVYGDLGDNIKQIEYYQRSLKIREELGDKHTIATVLSNIGLLYFKEGNISKALEYHQKALKINEELGNQARIAISLADVGKVYEDYEDYDIALEYYQKSLILGEEFGDRKDNAWHLSNLGGIYKAKSEYGKALNYYQRSMQLLVDMGAQPEISSLLAEIGQLYLVQENYSKAVRKCKEAYLIAFEMKDIRKQRTACECLYKGYKGLKNDNQALSYHEKMSILSDSLKSKETAKKLQQMEFAKTMLADSISQAETNRKIEIAHQEEVRKKNQTRNIALAIGAGILLLALLLYNRLSFVRKSKADLQVEKNRSENLLLNILPAEIAQELKDNGKAQARDFENVSILFTDFKSFTQTSEKLSAQELVKEINTCFEAFDGIIEKYGIEKIKTIGDAYMAAGGLPIPSQDSVKNTILAALEMQIFISDRIIAKRAKDEMAFEMRIGIHTGPVVAGIVGVKKFQYDVWGDTVNTASRVESAGEIGKVNVSNSTYELIKDDPHFSIEVRGKIAVKGKESIAMYFVTQAPNHIV